MNVTRDDCENLLLGLRVLGNRLERRFSLLKEHEPWPITIPNEWLEE